MSVHNGGTYVCTEGPRFETPAEIKMFHMLGGDTVGMTNVPEVNLANEAELPCRPSFLPLHYVLEQIQKSCSIVCNS